MSCVVVACHMTQIQCCGKSTCGLWRFDSENHSSFRSCLSVEYFQTLRIFFPVIFSRNIKYVMEEGRGQQTSVQSSETAVSVNAAGDPIQLDLPEQILKELFKTCDLPTRCKVRRVCRTWKEIVSLPEVNESVVVNIRCMLVSSPMSSYPRNLQYGWYNTGGNINLSDHRRNGLLGAHVRVLIFDGEKKRRPISCLTEIIHSIAMYCTRVKIVVLLRTMLKPAGADEDGECRGFAIQDLSQLSYYSVMTE